MTAQLPEHWNVLPGGGDGEISGSDGEVVRDFDLIPGGGEMSSRTRKNLSRASEREYLEQVHEAELARLETAYKANVAKVESIYRDVFAQERQQHASELVRLQGIIDKLIAKVGER